MSTDRSPTKEVPSMTSFVKSFRTFPYALFYVSMPSLSFIETMAGATRKIPDNIKPVPSRAALIQMALKRTGTISLIWGIGLLPMHAAFHFTAPDVWFFK